MGGHGVCYRASLGGSSARTRRGGTRQLAPRAAPPAPQPGYSDGQPLVNLLGADAGDLVPTGSPDVVAQLNAASHRPPWALLTVVAAVVLATLVPQPVGGVLGIVGLLAAVWLTVAGRGKARVVAFYQVDDAPGRWFEDLVGSWETLTAASRTWRVTGSVDVVGTTEWKRHSGASATISRAPATVTTTGPKHLVTNVAVPTMTSGNASLHFLPDRVLVRSGRTYSDVSYADLRAASGSQLFVETDTVAGDAVQVDSTWQHPNRSGGPDRRYKNNRQLPVMRYGRLRLTSAGGLSWVLDVSRVEPAAAVADAVRAVPSSTLVEIPAAAS